jgi:hypothetical protein
MWRQVIKALMCQTLNLNIDDEGDQQDDVMDKSLATAPALAGRAMASPSTTFPASIKI